MRQGPMATRRPSRARHDGLDDVGRRLEDVGPHVVEQVVE